MMLRFIGLEDIRTLAVGRHTRCLNLLRPVSPVVPPNSAAEEQFHRLDTHPR